MQIFLNPLDLGFFLRSDCLNVISFQCNKILHSLKQCDQHANVSQLLYFTVAANALPNIVIKKIMNIPNINDLFFFELFLVVKYVRVFSLIYYESTRI